MANVWTVVLLSSVLCVLVSYDFKALAIAAFLLRAVRYALLSLTGSGRWPATPQLHRRMPTSGYVPRLQPLSFLLLTSAIVSKPLRVPFNSFFRACRSEPSHERSHEDQGRRARQVRSRASVPHRSAASGQRPLQVNRKTRHKLFFLCFFLFF